MFNETKNENSGISLTQVEQIVEQAIVEDLSHGDITTELLITGNEIRKASIIAKANGVIAGTEVAKLVFVKVDPNLEVTILISDGTTVKPGNVIAELKGSCASILKAERVALNFLQHLSGIATETKRYVEAVKGLSIQITDTRKTIPGLRTLEKYAVRVGGGKNHRMHLGDRVLIKDNHIAILRSQGMSLKDIIVRARQNISKSTSIEIEVKTVQEAAEAASSGVDIIMLDNMNIEEMRQAVQLIKGHTLIEASGGIVLDKVRAIAETGIDYISIGALTHSSKALDISLELE